MRLAGSGSTYKHGVALLCDEVAAGEVANEGLVDRRVLEGEVVDVFGERQLGDGELILDRPRLLLRDLGAQEVSDKALRLVLALECGGVPRSGAPEAVVAGAVGDRRLAKRQRRMWKVPSVKDPYVTGRGDS